MTNPLAQLAKVGQSVWYDQTDRKLISTGKLQKMIDEDDLRGMTSNPTIFEKAIGGSEDYDAQLRMLASQGKSRDEIYDELVSEDIGNAADIFKPVYERTGNDDGYVSLEVSPLLAQRTDETVAEAQRLFTKLGRPNVMIKIPATPEGIPAIEEAIALGININVTLIFSNDVYAQVIEAYLRGLERRAAQGLPIGYIASVASFFVSRIDTAADKQIEAKLKDDPSRRAAARQDRHRQRQDGLSALQAGLHQRAIHQAARPRRARAASAVGLHRNEESEVQRRALRRVAHRPPTP